jgi:Type II CAAX prenyl endopeptidase Rce1-like
MAIEDAAVDPSTSDHAPADAGAAPGSSAAARAPTATAASPTGTDATSASAGPGVFARLSARPDPLSGIVLTLPVFLVYHLGILLVTERSSADLVSSLVFALLQASVSGYVIATLGFALALSATVWVRQRRGSVPSWALGRVLAESAALALLLVITVGWATYKLSGGVTLSAPHALSTLTRVVLACGAGFHEELVFRALMISGGSAALVKLFDMQRSAAVVLTVLVSSVAFGFAQYLGSFGDAFAFDTLAYRCLLGVALAAIYLLRGFALAVYTHVFFTALVYFVYA